MNIGIWNAEGEMRAICWLHVVCTVEGGPPRAGRQVSEEPRETGAGKPQSETNSRSANQSPNRMTSICSPSNQCVLILATESCLG